MPKLLEGAELENAILLALGKRFMNERYDAVRELLDSQLGAMQQFYHDEIIRHADMVIGTDESAYTDDGKRYFVHIEQQNNLRAEQRDRNKL